MFEAEIKRPWFHYKPLDESEIANWRVYLDFEEGVGDNERIVKLYERCLVPCAMYEEFWCRYAKYLISQGKTAEAGKVYAKACNVFIPPNRPFVRLVYASFLEERGDVTGAREVLRVMMEKLPGHIETAIHSAYFECRNSDPAAALDILNHTQSSTALEANGRAVIATHSAKIKSNFEGADVSEVREYFLECVEKWPESVFLSYTYVQWECGVKGDLSNLAKAWKIISTSQLPAPKKFDLGQVILGCMLERGCGWAVMKEVERGVDEVARAIGIQSGGTGKRYGEGGDEPRGKIARFDGGGVSSSFRF